jgi:hypothetical protein
MRPAGEAGNETVVAVADCTAMFDLDFNCDGFLVFTLRKRNITAATKRVKDDSRDALTTMTSAARAMALLDG